MVVNVYIYCYRNFTISLSVTVNVTFKGIYKSIHHLTLLHSPENCLGTYCANWYGKKAYWYTLFVSIYLLHMLSMCGCRRHPFHDNTKRNAKLNLKESQLLFYLRMYILWQCRGISKMRKLRIYHGGCIAGVTTCGSRLVTLIGRRYNLFDRAFFTRRVHCSWIQPVRGYTTIIFWFFEL